MHQSKYQVDQSRSMNKRARKAPPHLNDYEQYQIKEPSQSVKEI